MRTPTVVALALAVAACSGGDAPDPAASRSRPPASPSPLGNARGGTAAVAVSGALERRLTLQIDQRESQIHGKPGGLALFWESGGDRLALGGEPFTGTRETSRTLTLTFLFREGGREARYTSSDGGCLITMRDDPSSVDGSFRCREFTASDGARYRTEGTFSASR